MKLVIAIVRTERVEHVVTRLREVGVARLAVSHVHAMGSGVDPEHYRLSFEAGGAYTEKARIELVCRLEDAERVVNVIGEEARTGHRGDGIVAVLDVERCVKIRTGDENQLAVL